MSTKKAEGKKSNGGAENVRVVVRCRNLGPHELAQGHKQAVQLNIATRQVTVVSEAATNQWTFDAVYNNTFTQQDLFLQEAKPLCDSVMNGFNATIFAYGQSGSGKTFTMTGDTNDPTPPKRGLIPRCVEYLFAEIAKAEAANNQKKFKIKAQFVELYNGDAFDLLSTSKAALEVRQASATSNAFVVKGCSSVEVSSATECMAQYETGAGQRRVAETKLNNRSSRSHALFTLMVESTETDVTGPRVVLAKINMVDLAGSERAGKTGAEGSTLEEGCRINLSLSALALVIEKTAKGEKHIPYRLSPLTMLLKDSLGGNSKTVMFANCGPSHDNTSETISTLRFADRAKQIKNTPTINRDAKDAHIAELQARIAELEQRGAGTGEEEALRARVEELELELTQLRNDAVNDLEEEVTRLRSQIHGLVAKVESSEKLMSTAQQASLLATADRELKAHELSQLKHATARFLQDVGRVEVAQADVSVANLIDDLSGFATSLESLRSSTLRQEDLCAAVQAAEERLQENQRVRELAWTTERHQLREEAKRAIDEMELRMKLEQQLATQSEELAATQLALQRMELHGHETQQHHAAALAQAVSHLASLQDQLKTRTREVEKLQRMLESNSTHFTSPAATRTEEQLLTDLQALQIDKSTAELHITELKLALQSASEPVDANLLDAMVQQIRLQHQLHRLRHEQQKKLADMIRKLEFVKTGVVTDDTVNRMEEEQQLRRQLDAEKEECISALQTKFDVKMAQLTAERDQLESELMSAREAVTVNDRQHADDVDRLTQKLNKLSAKLTTTDAANRQLETERRQLASALSAAEEREISVTRALSQAQTKAVALDKVTKELKRAQQATQLAEGTIKEQADSISKLRLALELTQQQVREEVAEAATLRVKVMSLDEFKANLDAAWLIRLEEEQAAAVRHCRDLLEEQATRYEVQLSDERDKQRLLRRRLKAAKEEVQHAVLRCDEMILENDSLVGVVERMKLDSMRAHRALGGVGA